MESAIVWFMLIYVCLMACAALVYLYGWIKGNLMPFTISLWGDRLELGFRCIMFSIGAICLGYGYYALSALPF